MSKLRKLIPYCKTEGDDNCVYCQLDHVELSGVSDLVDHANKSILKLQKRNDKLELENKELQGKIDKFITEEGY